VTSQVIDPTIQLSKPGREAGLLNVHYEAVDSCDLLPSFVEETITCKEAVVSVEPPYPTGARSVNDVDGKVKTDLIKQAK
jgi:hypothetical protein